LIALIRKTKGIIAEEYYAGTCGIRQAYHVYVDVLVAKMRAAIAGAGTPEGQSDWPV
jgi:hypothetical protein